MKAKSEKFQIYLLKRVVDATFDEIAFKLDDKILIFNKTIQYSKISNFCFWDSLYINSVQCYHEEKASVYINFWVGWKDQTDFYSDSE